MQHANAPGAAKPTHVVCVRVCQKEHAPRQPRFPMKRINENCSAIQRALRRRHWNGSNIACGGRHPLTGRAPTPQAGGDNPVQILLVHRMGVTANAARTRLERPNLNWHLAYKALACILRVKM